MTQRRENQQHGIMSWPSWTPLSNKSRVRPCHEYQPGNFPYPALPNAGQAPWTVDDHSDVKVVPMMRSRAVQVGISGRRDSGDVSARRFKRDNISCLMDAYMTPQTAEVVVFQVD